MDGWQAAVIYGCRLSNMVKEVTGKRTIIRYDPMTGKPYEEDGGDKHILACPGTPYEVVFKRFEDWSAAQHAADVLMRLANVDVQLKHSSGQNGVIGLMMASLEHWSESLDMVPMTAVDGVDRVRQALLSLGVPGEAIGPFLVVARDD